VENIDIELTNLLVTAVVRLGGALIIVLIGRWIAGLARRSVHATLERASATPSIADLLERLAYSAVLLLSVLIALVVLGVSPQILAAAMVVVAVVAAVALRESLGDLAATILFIMFKPFQVGDIIETNGVKGGVQEIQLFSTVLISVDHRKIILPNSSIQNGVLVNYSALDGLRIDITVDVSYSDDIAKAREAMLQIAAADPRVVPEPAPVVHLMELAESGVRLVLRVYAKPEDYYALFPALNERIKLEFDRLGLTIPFPQMDVHVGRGGTGE